MPSGHATPALIFCSACPLQVRQKTLAEKVEAFKHQIMLEETAILNQKSPDDPYFKTIFPPEDVGFASTTSGSWLGQVRPLALSTLWAQD